MARDHSGPIIAESRPRPPGLRREAGFVIGILAFVAVAALAIALVMYRGKSGYLLGQWTEAEAKLMDIQEVAQLTGTVEMMDKRVVLSPEEGVITAVHVETGAWVEAGKIIASLGNVDLPDELATAKTELEAVTRSIQRADSDRVYARAKEKIDIKQRGDALARAQTELASAMELAALGSASEQSVLDARRAQEDAQSALELAQLQAESAESSYAYDAADDRAKKASLEKSLSDLAQRIAALQIRAPIAGRVLSWSAGLGDRLSKYGQLALVADTKKPTVAFFVPETIATRVSPGMKVSISVGSGVYPGRLISLGREATASDSYGTTVDASAVFDSPPAELSAGMTASGELSLGVNQGAVVLPRGSYLTSGGSRWIYVIKEGQAERRACSFGISQTDSIEVLSGLAVGERVIVSDYGAFIDFKSVKLGGKK